MASCGSKNGKSEGCAATGDWQIEVGRLENDLMVSAPHQLSTIAGIVGDRLP